MRFILQVDFTNQDIADAFELLMRLEGFQGIFRGAVSVAAENAACSLIHENSRFNYKEMDRSGVDANLTVLDYSSLHVDNS